MKALPMHTGTYPYPCPLPLPLPLPTLFLKALPMHTGTKLRAMVCGRVAVMRTRLGSGLG